MKVLIYPVTMSLTFADVTPIQQVSSHSYSIDLGDEWCIGNGTNSVLLVIASPTYPMVMMVLLTSPNAVPNGGYVTSCFLLAARTHMSKTHSARSEPHPINLHLEFLRRTSARQAIFKVKDVKLGSRISNLHLTLEQEQENGKVQVAVEGYITMSNIAKESGLSLPTRFELHPVPISVDLPTLGSKGEDQNWALRRNQAFPQFRRASQNIEIHLEKPDQRPTDRPISILDQWVRFCPLKKPGKWTNDCFGFVVDMFPQIVESYINAERGESDLHEKAPDPKNPRKTFWYPTLSLNLDVKQLLPVEGIEWLFVRMEAKKIHNGRLDLMITVLDERGDIVALSTHNALVMDAQRNVQKRGQDKQDSKL